MERVAHPLSHRAPRHRGVRLVDGGIEVCVFSRHADCIWLCLFDAGSERELARWRLAGRDGDDHHGFIPAVRAGARYGLRADGPWQPENGHLFDPMKLLVDPLATRIDRHFRHSREICAPRSSAIDTAPFVPRAIVEARDERRQARDAEIRSPSLIYEVAVRAFTKLHPDVPVAQRGTLAGLAHPRVVEHLVRLGVSHIELMPITAWIDERHLPPLGLANAWGYNPVTFMAPDPRLSPGGLDDLRDAVDKLHEAGIGVILDVVFNHTGESDREGATLSLRGLDNAVYYRMGDGGPVNDSGCGNTLACDREPVTDLVLDSLRHFVRHAGVDGFRFDLATVLGRSDDGFDPRAPLLAKICDDPELAGLHMIAEPWDVGPGGYRLGAFGAPWSEWNDRYRDDVRRFWRGDADAIGPFATRLSGSADYFSAESRTPAASINFIAAHDGFTLADLVGFEKKHNRANGEDNRDGTDANFSWNCGVEGASEDNAINAARENDIRAVLATLFLSLGTPMLTAGDEFGRTQHGNNNAYAQDNGTTWLDWDHANHDLPAFVARLCALRAKIWPTGSQRFLNGVPPAPGQAADVEWLGGDGSPMRECDWSAGALLAVMHARDDAGRMLVVFNRGWDAEDFAMPGARQGHAWSRALGSRRDDEARDDAPGAASAIIPARSVIVFEEARVRGNCE